MEIERNDTLDLDLVGHSSEARIAFVPPVSVKDRSLYWVLGRSQTYYPKHILMYGHEKTHCSLVMGSGSFLDRLIGGGDGGGPCTALSQGLRSGGLESKFGRGPRPRDRRVMGWSCLCLGYKWGMCFWGTQLGTLIHESPTIRYYLSTI